MPALTTWAVGMTGNFPDLLRLAADADRQTVTEAAVRLFLKSDGRTDREVLLSLPRDLERAQRRTAARPRSGEVEGLADIVQPGDPDEKRYRDPRQLVRAIGLAYDVDEADGKRVRVTELGRAVMRWVHDGLNADNVRVIAGYAARSLSAVQLRNPTTEGRRYVAEMEVFPLAFIWRAMLALDGRLTREELNRGLYRVRNEDELAATIASIRDSRVRGDISIIGERAAERGEGGSLTSRRVRSWMAWASFGWTLFADVTAEDEGFQIRSTWAREVLEEAALTRRRHQEFDDVGQYVEHLSRCAGLPPDLRITL